MKNINVNRKLFAIHGWLGLLLGIVFGLISVGGASIVFYAELNQWLYGDDIYVGTKEGKRMSFDQLYDMARKEYPRSSFIGVGYDPKHPENAYNMSGVDGIPVNLFENGRYRNDYVDPYTGQIIFKTDGSFSGSAIAWLDSLHASLRLGLGGAVFVGLMSVAVLLNLITGLIFYRKFVIKVLLFQVKFKFKNWRTISSDLHRIVGTWALIVNIFIFGSGFYMYYALFTPDWWKENWPPKNVQVVSPKALVSLDSLAERAMDFVPGMVPSTIGIMHDTTDVIIVSGVPKEKLFWGVDNYASVTFKTDGTFKEKYDKKWGELTGKEKFDNVNFAVLHTGWALGMIGKIVWTIFGFAPAALSLTGFILWWRKKRKNILPARWVPVKAVSFFLGLAMIFCACTKRDNRLTEAKRIFAESMKVHDEIMPRMDEMYRLERRLRSVRDSLLSDSIRNKQKLFTVQKGLTSLARTEKDMMDWMHHIQDVPKASGNKHSRAVPSEQFAAGPQEILLIQQKQKDKIDALKLEMERSIQETREYFED